ncbi:hypothetical protein D3C87_600070 [compost metagenome]
MGGRGEEGDDLSRGADARDGVHVPVRNEEVGNALHGAHDAMAVPNVQLEGVLGIGHDRLAVDREVDGARDGARGHLHLEGSQVGAYRADDRRAHALVAVSGELDEVVLRVAGEVAADELQLLPDDLLARTQEGDRERNLRQKDAVEVDGVERDPAHGVPLGSQGFGDQGIGVLNHGQRNEDRVRQLERVGEGALGDSGTDGSEEGLGVDRLGRAQAEADDDGKGRGHRVDEQAGGHAVTGERDPAATAVARDRPHADDVGAHRIGFAFEALEPLDGLEVVKRPGDGLEAVGVLEDELPVGIRTGRAQGLTARNLDQRDGRAGSDVIGDGGLEAQGAEVDLTRDLLALGLEERIRGRNDRERPRTCRDEGHEQRREDDLNGASQSHRKASPGHDPLLPQEFVEKGAARATMGE